MAARSAKLLGNLLQKRAFITTRCNTPRTTITTFTPKPFRNTRFYTSVPKQEHTPKLSTLVSSPEIIKAAKVEPKASKLKELTKKYGAAGIMVYLAVGCVDLGITLGVIQLVGLEKVKVLEEGVLDIVYNTGEKFGIKRKEEKKPEQTAEDTVALARNDTPSFASVFILAYGIHKTLLLPVRLGITAAITPAIVRKLHQMGWTRYFPRLFGMTKP